MGNYKKILSETKLSNEMLDRSNWPTVHENSLDIEKKEVYKRRKNAIDMYIDGEKTVDEIISITQINRTDIYRLIRRCLQIDNNGEVLGYRALIPNYRVSTYKRGININGNIDDSKKLTGAFHKFLFEFPDIEENIKDLVFNKRKNTPSTNIPSVKDLHRKFINICKKHPLIDERKGDYPFNTNEFARSSFYRYIRELKLSNPYQTIKDHGKDSETLFKSTGYGDKNGHITRPYQRVEFDGHKIDTAIAIRFTTPEGDEIVDVMNRIWLLTIVDCATHNILGYKVVLNSEYSSTDVLECVKNAILPRNPVEFTIPGLTIPEYGGFSSNLIPETEYAIWDEMLFDNALANIAKIVKDNLKKLVGCQVNTGPVATPTRRPLVEKLFHLLEQNGFHKLPSTTGSNPKDPNRQNPEEKAIKYEITSDEIEQLVEVLIASRNGTPIQTLNGLSPLEVMQQRINRKIPFRKLKEEYRDGTTFLTIEDYRIIRGSQKKGRRPYITYMNVPYRNDVLSGAFNLIGEKITLVINIDDLRLIRAYLPNGSELGLLKATGKWSISKHNLKIRRTIMKLVRDKQFSIAHDDNPIEIYNEYLKEKAKNKKSSRNQLAALEKMLNNDMNKNNDTNVDLDSGATSNSAELQVVELQSVVEVNKNSTKLNHYKRRERFSFNS